MGGRTISIRDHGNQNMRFKPNHDVFLTVTKRLLCVRQTEGSEPRCDKTEIEMENST